MCTYSLIWSEWRIHNECEITMGVKGLKSVQKKLERVKEELPRKVNDAVDDGLADTERRAKRRIVRQDAVHTTTLYRSFRTKTVPIGHVGTRHTLTNTATHSGYVEWGTGDYFGTTQFLAQPTQRFDAPQMSTRLVNQLKYWVSSKPSLQPDGPREGFAVYLAKRISGLTKKPSGTPPQPFMRPAWQRGQRTVITGVRRAAKTALR